MEKISDKIGFKNSFVVDPIGRARGLALFWNEEFHLEILGNSKRMIHCSIWDPRGLNIKDIITCYGVPYIAEKRLFWDSLQEVVETIKGP